MSHALHAPGRSSSRLALVLSGVALGVLAALVGPAPVALAAVGCGAGWYAVRSRPTLLVWGVVGASLFLPALPLGGLGLNPALAPLAGLAVAFGGAVLAGEGRVPYPRLLALAGLTALAGVLSLVGAFSQFGVARVALGGLYLGQWVTYLALPALVAVALRRHGDTDRAVETTVAVTLLASAAMALYLLALLLLDVRPTPTTVRIAGLRPLTAFWEQGNLAVGMFVALTATVCTGLAVELDDRRVRAALALLAALTGFLTLTSLSRSSILALAAGLLVVGLVRAPRWTVLGVVLAGTVGVVAAPDFLVERLTRSTFYSHEVPALGTEIPVGALWKRVNGWVRLGRIAAEDPLLGVGFSLSRFRAAQLYGTPISPDSQYVALVVETGVVGLAAFVLYVRHVLATTLGVYRSDATATVRGVALGTVGAFAGFLVWAAFQGVYARWRVLGPLFVWVGIVVAATDPGTTAVDGSDTGGAEGTDDGGTGDTDGTDPPGSDASPADGSGTRSDGSDASDGSPAAGADESSAERADGPIATSGGESDA